MCERWLVSLTLSYLWELALGTGDAQSTTHPFVFSDQFDNNESQGWLRHTPLASAVLVPA